MKAVVAAFNQEKALVGAFFVITNLRMELFEALVVKVTVSGYLCVSGLDKVDSFMVVGWRQLDIHISRHHERHLSPLSRERGEMLSRGVSRHCHT